MSDIDFIVSVIENSLPFAEFLLETGNITKSGKHNIHWKCVLSNGAKKIPEGFECLGEDMCDSLSPSMRHAESIHRGLKNAKSDYIIIADVDIALTHKNWDDEVVKILDGETSCFGTENHSESLRYYDFPCVPFIAFKKDIISELELDFRPVLNRVRLEGKMRLTKKGEEEIMQLDTCCRLPAIFKKAGLKSKCLQCIAVSSNDIQLSFKNLSQKIISLHHMNKRRKSHGQQHSNMGEWHYNGKVFLTHLGSSRFNTFDDDATICWRERIERYIANQNF
jgi:hypothetical protein